MKLRQTVITVHCSIEKKNVEWEKSFIGMGKDGKIESKMYIHGKETKEKINAQKAVIIKS